MVTELNSVNNQIKPGCCPHGLPFGACPACTKSGGTSRPTDRRNPGEMTYHECAMLGNLMKARALAKKNHEANLKQHILNAEQFQTTMEKLIQNMKEFNKILSQNFVYKPIAFMLTVTVIPVLKLIKNISKFVSTLNNIRFEITDKLNAIYGEIKAFLNKKLEEIMKMLKSPSILLSKIFKKNNTDNDDTKIDDDKKIFNLKTIIHKLKEKFKNKKDKQNEHDSKNQ